MSPRLLVVANRLPVHRGRREEGGGERWETSPGGLVSALKPILERTGGSWVGWDGAGRSAGRARRPFTHEGVDLIPVAISKREADAYYHGFANATLWPLYHDAIRTPRFEPRWWEPYVEVNRRFAEAAAAALGPRDVAWVHDYHLQLVPRFLRDLRPRARIGFFLHIPFPPPELFAQLPWRRALLEGLLAADLVGFQTRGGARNFLEVARRYAGAKLGEDTATLRGRATRARAFPISIDFAAHDALARAPETSARAERLARRVGGRRILLGVDRLDYTKGIDVRLSAVEALLGSGRLDPERAVFLQIAVPSREDLTEYAQIRTEVERRVGRINGVHGEPGRAAVHYLYRSLPIEELSAYYRAAETMLVTPLRDGMNLVAKEYVAAHGEERGVLVLSEFAGAARELRQALLVNPHDVDGVAAAIEQALAMPDREAARRMRAMRRTVGRHDVHRWSKAYLETLAP